MAFFDPKRARLIFGLFAGVLLLLGAGDDAARIDRIGHQIMCVCGCNQILLECNHVGCSYSSRMRDELTAAVTRGDSDNVILQWFIQTYGTTVLAVPTKTGFNRIAWIMPYLALVLGIGLVVLILWMWKQRPAPANASATAAMRRTDLDRFRQQARRETEL
ncbi:MAG TPA: cytochrome c-type biogenesis protein CcmH [Terriglobales bacterium]|nr:cytochrome c-type biogenesis protein CcmH [Terriglobales bacterium]